MKKVLIAILIGVGIFPYIFLGSSVTDKDGQKREYKCQISKPKHYKEFITFGSVYYSFSHNMSGNQRIILPYFGMDTQVYSAECGGQEFLLGQSDWMKPGTKIRLYTQVQVVKLFGIKLFEEEGMYMFGND